LIELGCDEKKIEVLPVGLDVSYFKKELVRSENKNQFQLLFVGRLIELKGPMNFLKICKQLQHRNRIVFKAVIIGEGPLFQDLQDYIENEGLTEKVLLARGKTQEETREDLNESDIFILPGIEFNGLAEAQGLVIQEAQAMELPVLVSDAGGMAEGVLEGITGYVLPQKDVEAFVDKIEYLARNPSIRKRMGSAGRKFVEENYDSQFLAEKLIDVYN
jgi:colanic acid/amylovoran biosynthesis glycosyltransferase